MSENEVKNISEQDSSRKNNQENTLEGVIDAPTESSKGLSPSPAVQTESPKTDSSGGGNQGGGQKKGKSKKKKKKKPVEQQPVEQKPEEGANVEDEPHEDGDNRKRIKLDWELEENLKAALDEDAMDLTEATEDESEPIEIEGKSAITLKQAAQAAFGLFLMIFSIIGVAATGIKLYQLHKAMKDNSAELEYFEQFLLPLAACDAPTFDGAPSLNEDVMISAACWDIIFHPSAFYERSGESYKVSYIDIDRRITKLFGPGLSYSHKTVGDTELRFTYDEESGMYLIPAFPRSNAYYPDVTEISELDNGALELTVCYHLPITNWIDTIDTVEKTMIYTVSPSDGDYIVSAIRIGEIDMSEAV